MHISTSAVPSVRKASAAHTTSCEAQNSPKNFRRAEKFTAHLPRSSFTCALTAASASWQQHCALHETTASSHRISAENGIVLSSVTGSCPRTASKLKQISPFMRISPAPQRQSVTTQRASCIRMSSTPAASKSSSTSLSPEKVTAVSSFAGRISHTAPSAEVSRHRSAEPYTLICALITALTTKDEPSRRTVTRSQPSRQNAVCAGAKFSPSAKWVNSAPFCARPSLPSTPAYTAVHTSLPP